MHYIDLWHEILSLKQQKAQFEKSWEEEAEDARPTVGGVRCHVTKDLGPPTLLPAGVGRHKTSRGGISETSRGGNQDQGIFTYLLLSFASHTTRFKPVRLS